MCSMIWISQWPTSPSRQAPPSVSSFLRGSLLLMQPSPAARPPLRQHPTQPLCLAQWYTIRDHKCMRSQWQGSSQPPPPTHSSDWLSLSATPTRRYQNRLTWQYTLQEWWWGTGQPTFRTTRPQWWQGARSKVLPCWPMQMQPTHIRSLLLKGCW